MTARRGAPRDPDSQAGRIRSIIQAEPDATNAAIAARTGVTVVYVIQVRRRLALAELRHEARKT